MTHPLPAIADDTTLFAASLAESDPEIADVVRRAKGAIHLSKGVVELGIEETVPNVSTPIICYCGGGSRSALAADNLQKMGYTNVASMAGGFRAWKNEGLPTS